MRKFDKRGRQTINIAQPFEAYTLTNNQIDPGPDNVMETSDDRTLVLWAAPRTYPGFGLAVNRLMNVPGAGNHQYSSFEATFSKRYSNRWSMPVSFNSNFRKVRAPVSGSTTTSIPTNPNDLLYDASAPVWDRTFKIVGTYDLPMGFTLATNYNAQSGEPYNRQVLVRNALNSSLTVTVQPFSGYYQWVKLWDNRISKVFRIGERQQIQGNFDWVNVLNSSAVLTQDNRNGATFRRPQTTIAPRIFRLGVQWKF